MALRQTVFWLGQVLPPLLILVLWRTPPNFLNAFLWLAAGVAAAVSMTTFMRIVAGRLRKARLVRSSLTILLFAGAFVSGVHSKGQANQYAWDLAQEVQEQCVMNGKCPTGNYFSDWEETSLHDALTWHCAPGCYRLDYGVNPNGLQEFFLGVKYSMDDGCSYSGGVEKPLPADAHC